jgi:2-polyprenyl-6-methoxyphenol hydroxylase-like FAD-dependent oxidoreductase
MALSPDGKGRPAEVKTASKITDIDPKTATVMLKNGESFSGDLVLGADGVHSVARTKIPGGILTPFGSGKSAFRFLIPWQTLADDPLTKDYVVGRQNKLSMWYGNDRRLVMYPCSFGTLMNFVAIHPTELSDVQSEGEYQQSR